MEPLTISSFASAAGGMTHFFGTRIAPNRWPKAEEMGIGIVNPGPAEFPLVASVKQVHGTDALILDRPLKGGDAIEGGWDALISDQPKVLLTVRTADCVPVFVHDPDHRVVAAVHAGWRGTLHGIVPKTLQALAAHFGSNVERVEVAIGPSAGACCYEIDAPVISILQEQFEEWESVFDFSHQDRGRLNLKEMIHRQVVNMGVPRSKSHRLDFCTICRSDLFYSHRREGERRGTMVSGIMLTPSL